MGDVVSDVSNKHKGDMMGEVESRYIIKEAGAGWHELAAIQNESRQVVTCDRSQIPHPRIDTCENPRLVSERKET